MDSSPLPEAAGTAEGAGLQTCLVQFLGTRVRNLRVAVSDAGIVLQGRADSFYAKQLAQEAVRKHFPQTILANEIEVTETTAAGP